MTIVFVRDDDANACTDPSRLERVYAPLLDAGIPLNLAVIPEVGFDTLAPDGTREAYLPEDVAARSEPRPLRQDSPLSRWIAEHPAQLSVLMHGLSHRRRRGGTEFGGLSSAEARAAIARGLQILTEALGQTPFGFVAPWDAMSRGALRAATEAFDLISTGWVDRSRLEIGDWPAHALERISHSHVLGVRHAWVLRHAGCKVQATTSEEEVPGLVAALTAGPEVAVIVLHHWMYWNRDRHPAIVALARELRRHHTVSAAETIRYLDALGWGHAWRAVGRRLVRSVVGSRPREPLPGQALAPGRYSKPGADRAASASQW